VTPRTVCLLVVLVCAAAQARAADTVTVQPSAIRIVAPPAADNIAEQAAAELRLHLRLITGVEPAPLAADEAVEGKFLLRVGAADPEDKEPMAPEEARYSVGPAGAFFYGEGKSYGALFAVCAFLEDQLGVRWMMPGDRGIAFEPRVELKLTTGRAKWAPAMQERKIRPYARPGVYPQKKGYVEEFWDFVAPNAAYDQLARDLRQWQLRMRMGGHSGVNYGHAFNLWWKKYGKTNPELFAMKKDGKREPEQANSDKYIYTADNPKGFQNIKLCPSNPAVAKRIVDDWVAAGKRSKWINVCENDSPPVNFCECPECRKLDVMKDGEKFGEHLTDRYIHMANAVARLAREIDPQAGAVMYAYNETEQPPRREKLAPNVFVVIVPTTADLAQLEALLGGWREAGARQTLLRPNLILYYETTAMPLGLEKQMFDVFQIARKNGCVGGDYDSLVGQWAVCGISDYILARAMSDPDKPFEYWEDHYYAAFGPAADEAKAYFRFWRQEVWDKRLRPDMDKIVTKGKYFNFARGLMWSLDQYYKAADFDQAEALLQPAMKKPLTDAQRDKLNQLVLSCQHARLLFLAVTSKGEKRFEYARPLLQFRQQHKNDLCLNWLGIFASESRFGDVAGLKTAVRLAAYPPPWIPTALPWNFRLDPKDAGLREKWQELPREETKKWEMLRTDAAWENPYDGENFPSPALRAQLKNYNGIGWYATSQRLPAELKGREIHLYFGGVDESCWVYVNGKPAGERVFSKPDDWNTPFEIRIDPQIEWDQPEQRITVRVEDKDGSGGIWRPVWIVSKKK